MHPSIEMIGSLDGRTALVTGASSGIGRGIAIALARAGANVVVNYVGDEGMARDAVDEVLATGVRAVGHRADVSREAEVLDMFERIRAEFGDLDILVNNAGLQRDAPLHEMSLERWQTVIDVNLTGQFLCAREAVRAFRGRQREVPGSSSRGSIVCISSVHETIPWAGHVNYAASKGGVMMLMKSLAQEVAPHRIRVNSIAPGAIRTAINRPAWETPEALEALLELVPYKRIGEPQDIARAAVWLASDASDYVTGTTLFVDGGMTLYPEFADGG